ncbi:MAG: YHS domain-containing (seleno)protein [Alphaproteobacteria bacterium]
MINLRRDHELAAIAAIVVLMAVGQAAAGSPNGISNISVSGADNVAIKGYDPVAYFADGHAEAGSKEFAYQWAGATWLFSDPTHRDSFKAKPEKYAPQYGGYSAYAVAEGAPAVADPTIWTILDGKLYLNTSEAVRKQWLAEIEGFIETADANWAKIETEAETAPRVAPPAAVPVAAPGVQPVSTTAPVAPAAKPAPSQPGGGKLPDAQPN